MSSFERQSIAQYASATSREKTEASAKTSSPPGSTDPKEILSQQFGSLELLERRSDCDFYLARTRSSSDDAQSILLKVLRSEVALDSKKLELFQLESSAAAKLKHPNIIESFPAEHLSGVHFARIKHHAEAEKLSQLLEREGWLDIERAVEITRQIANALEYAHDCGVLHLRIEPRSVLIGSGGTVILRDFGIDEHGGLTWAQAQRAAACPDHYISPEVAAERPLDARSDVYSLGVVFYQMLTDRFPIDAENSAGIRNRHLTHQPLLPHYYAPDTPEAVSEVVARMLEKDPAKRFQDVKSLRAALDKAIGRAAVRISQRVTTVERNQDQFQEELSDLEVPSAVASIEPHKFEPNRNEQIETEMSGPSKSNETFEEVQPLIEPTPHASLQTIEELSPAIETTRPVHAIDTSTGGQQEIEQAAPIWIEREPWEPPSIIGIEPEVPPTNSTSRIEERIREWESATRQSVPDSSYFIDRLSFDPIAQTKTIGRFNPVVLVIVLAAAVLGGVFVLARFEGSKANGPQNEPVVTSSEKSAAESTATAPTSAAPEQPPPNAAASAAVPTRESVSGSHSKNKNNKSASGAAATPVVRASQSTSISKRSQRSGTTKKPWRRSYRRFGTSYFDR